MKRSILDPRKVLITDTKGKTTGYIKKDTLQPSRTKWGVYNSNGKRGMDAYCIKPDDDDFKQAMDVYTVWFDEQLEAAKQTVEKELKVNPPLLSS